AQMPDEFYDLLAHHLPPEQPVGPAGGRPRIGHRVVMRVIWFVLATGTRWEDVPHELGCSGRTAHRRLLAWEELGIWDGLHADRGYDSEATRWILRWLGIDPHIAKRGTPHGSGLGKVRWVVERTISWLKGLRRMRVRYDRLGVVRDAWTSLAASVICFN